MNRKVTVVAAPAMSARPWPAASPTSSSPMSSSSISPTRRPPASRSTCWSRVRSTDPTSRVHRRPATTRETANSDVVVITSGVPRKPGMSRDDLLNVNFGIMKAGHRAGRQVLAELHHRPGLEPARRDVRRRSTSCQRFPRERVIGMAGVLDSARMRTFIAMELNVSVENVHAFVLGGHGDTMVPLPRYSTVAGIPITELLAKATDRSRSATRTADGGAEITKLVGTSAWYAPGAAAVEMVEAILKGQEEDPAVLGVPAGRVRRQRSVRRRAGKLGASGSSRSSRSS